MAVAMAVAMAVVVKAVGATDAVAMDRRAVELPPGSNDRLPAAPHRSRLRWPGVRTPLVGPHAVQNDIGADADRVIANVAFAMAHCRILEGAAEIPR